MHAVDLLIVGSGPAGLSTALHLIHQDDSWADRLLLLEKKAHPRPKLCGGAVTRLGLKALTELGFDLPLPIPHARVDEVRIAYRSRTVHVRGEPQLLVFNRAEFDDYLARQARQRGAQIRENEAVEAVAVGEEAVTVITTRDTYRAKAVVGADGAKGVVRRYFNDRRSPKRIARLLETWRPSNETAPRFQERFALFDFTPVEDGLQGYFWDFPYRVNGQAYANKGVYDARVARKRPRALLPQILHTALSAQGDGRHDSPLAGHPIHWFSPRARISAPRVLLVGDAAGVDPLFGEGIAPALAYGKIAAATLLRAFSTGDYAFRDYRRRVLLSPLGRYLLVRCCVAWWSYRLSDRDWFMRGLWALGAGLSRLWPEPPPLYARRSP